MVTSIVLMGEYSIGVDKNEKFQLGDKKIGLKEVPFVRYRLDNYTEATVAYIKKMMVTFRYSCHMAEVQLKVGTRAILDMLSANFDNMAILLSIPVTDDNVNNGFSQDILALLAECRGAIMDRVVIKDNSNSLHMIAANRLKTQVGEALGINSIEIGICSSPLSFSTGEACLTAVKARELAAMYSENDEGALPSANHECMQTCGCIRYMKVTSNISAPIVHAKFSNSKSTNKSTSKTKIDRKVIPRY